MSHKLGVRSQRGETACHHLHVLEIDAESVSGSLELAEANTSLGGKFEAPRCPPP
jgi:hypothetical protein